MKKKPIFFGKINKQLNKKANNNLNELKTYFYTFQQSSQTHKNFQKISGCIQSKSFIVKITKPKQRLSELQHHIEIINKLIQQHQLNQFKELFKVKSWLITPSTLDLYLPNTRKVLVHLYSVKELLNLKITYRQEKLTLLMFSHIKFQNLKELTIDSPIQNLQPLVWMDITNLLHISLLRVRIVSIKPLAKLKLTKLLSLDIKTLGIKLVKHNQNLGRILMNKICRISFGFFPQAISLIQRNICPLDISINFIAKLQTMSFDVSLLRQIGIQSLRQRKITNKLILRCINRSRAMIDDSEDSPSFS